jgi:hypothetical protein
MTAMSDLLDKAIEAHGGWHSWQAVGKLTLEANVGGGLLLSKGKSGIIDDVHIEIDTRRQHVEYCPFGDPGRRYVWEPGRTVIATKGAAVIDIRENPRASFAGHVHASPWDDHHFTYFIGCAIWTYVTTPFLLRLPGFETEEVEPWNENGDQWRRLKAIFPDTIASHSKEQVFYFDGGGILRRHDYYVDVSGGFACANYALNPRRFSDFIMSTKRRVYRRGPDNKPVKDRVVVAIDIRGIDV